MRSFTIIIALIVFVRFPEAYAQGNSLPEKANTSSSIVSVPNAHFPPVASEVILSGVLAGITLFAVICLVLLIVTFKKRFYGYLLFYALSFLVVLIIENYFVLRGLSRSGGGVLVALRVFCATLLPLANLLFLRRFWQTRIIAKRFDDVLQTLVFIYSFVIVFVLLGNAVVWETRVMPVLSIAGELLLLFLCRLLWKKRATLERFSHVEMLATAMVMLVLPGEGLVSSILGLFGVAPTGAVLSGAVSESLSSSSPSVAIFSVLTCIQLVLFPCAFFVRIRDDNKRYVAVAQERLVAEQQALAENRRNDALRRANAEILGQQELLEKQRKQIEGMNVALHENNLQLSTQNLLLKELHHEKDEFLGIVAHDLKNPLAAIASFANILRHDDGSLMPMQQKEFVGHIIESAERMFVIIRNLLDLNALERGGLRVHLQPIEISSILDYAVSSYRERAVEKQITFHTDFAPVPFALGDEALVMQVVENLLSNALKYSPHGKNVMVRIMTITVPQDDTIAPNIPTLAPLAPLASTFAARASSFVRFEVRDEGPGLTDDDKSKVFGKFARLSAQPTGGEHSTGLGLSIVKKMVDAMNGRVFCESCVGEGAAFIVELPVADYEQ